MEKIEDGICRYDYEEVQEHIKTIADEMNISLNEASAHMNSFESQASRLQDPRRGAS